jgi:transcriptional regulator of arginine metabolism
MKERRQRAILTLVATRPVHSQEELVALLRRQGFIVTQATVSRDIKELGLAKVPVRSQRGEDIFKYVVPAAAVNYVSRLHRAVSELVTSIQDSVNLIVLHSAPGSGMMIASALDEATWPELIGTIGGDDTVLAIVRAVEDVPHVKQRFLDLKNADAA